MTIAPPTDILLDVARAADPARLEAARMRLAAGAPAALADDHGFDAAFSALAGTSSASSSAAPAPADTGGGPVEAGLTEPRNNAVLFAGSAGHARLARARQPSDVFRDFEAMTLTEFISEMLPAESEGVFGSGTAGSVYRSMLAQELGKALAADGGIGIARTVEASLPASAKRAAAAGKVAA